MTKQMTVFPLRLPNSLKAAVAGICREDGTSINQFVSTAVAEKVSAMKTAEFFAAHAADADTDAALRLLHRGRQPATRTARPTGGQPVGSKLPIASRLSPCKFADFSS